MVEEIETAMKGMLAPEYHEVITGQAEIRQVIKASKQEISQDVMLPMVQLKETVVFV